MGSAPSPTGSSLCCLPSSLLQPAYGRNLSVLDSAIHVDASREVTPDTGWQLTQYVKHNIYFIQKYTHSHWGHSFLSILAQKGLRFG